MLQSRFTPYRRSWSATHWKRHRLALTQARAAAQDNAG
jgi:hypothetical protein